MIDCAMLQISLFERRKGDFVHNSNDDNVCVYMKNCTAQGKYDNQRRKA